jgi:hypothetical protein
MRKAVSRLSKFQNDVQEVMSVMREYVNDGDLRHGRVQFPESIADLCDSEPMERATQGEQVKPKSGNSPENLRVILVKRYCKRTTIP